MNLHDHLTQAVDHAETDLDRLVANSRKGGTRLSRQRKALGVAGVAAGAVLAVSVTTSLSHGPASETPREQPAASPTEPFNSDDTGRITGAGVTAALLYSVSELQSGTATSFEGQDPNPGLIDVGANGQFSWTETGAAGMSIINITVSSDAVNAAELGCIPIFGGRPQEPLEDCQASRLPDGSDVITYRQTQRVESGLGIRRIAQVLRPDGTSVRVTSSNGREIVRRFDWDITRPKPALSYEQLRQIAIKPWWGAEIPTYFLEQGPDLDPYNAVTPFGAKAPGSERE